MTMAKGIMIVDGQRVPFDGEKMSLRDPQGGHRHAHLLLLFRAFGPRRLPDVHRGKRENSGNCRLQALAQRFGVSRVRFPDTWERYEQDNTSLAIFRDPNKCILCGDCVRVCEELQGQGILNYAHRGSELQVMPAFDKKLDQTKCVGCGQCAAVCTTGAITVKNQIGQAWQALHDPKNRVVVQIAPAVRVALGEEFGLPAGANVMDKLVKALKLMGVEEVYDTNFAADMTTISEAQEFLARLKTAVPSLCSPAAARPG